MPRPIKVVSIRTAARRYAKKMPKAVDHYKAGVANPRRQRAAGPYDIDKAARKMLSKRKTGASNYSRGFAPYLEVLSNLVLPPRYPLKDPRNIMRVQAVAQALRAEKERRKALRKKKRALRRKKR